MDIVDFLKIYRMVIKYGINSYTGTGVQKKV